VHDKCIAVKTITIDLEAYDALSRHKKPGQSFSQVIKEHLGRRKSAGAFKRALRTAAFSDRTLDRIDVAVANRRRSTARVPES
jgi:predicted CopG family antitoxin